MPVNSKAPLWGGPQAGSVSLALDEATRHPSAGAMTDSRKQSGVRAGPEGVCRDSGFKWVTLADLCPLPCVSVY